MAASEKNEGGAAAAPVGAAPSGGGSKLVTIITLVNFVVTIAMVAILFISFQRDQAKPRVEDISAEESHDGGGEHGGASSEGEHGGGGHGGEHGGAAKKTGDFGKMVTLDQFTVNLSTPGSVNPKFFRVNIALEVPNDDAESEVTSKMPQVRNTIIDLINSKRTSDLATAEGREYLKDEIKNGVNSFMVSGKVKGVYFTNFAVSP